VNDELERMWKEEVMAYFKVLSRHLPGRPAKTHEKLVRTDGVYAEI
jgi:hypothetical protein